MKAQETTRKLAFANLMARACAAYQVKRLDEATFSLYYNALAKYSIADLNEQLDRHIDISEFFPKVVEMKPYNAKVSPDEDRTALIRAYCAPLTVKNPKGNPLHVQLSESTSQRGYSESVDNYERRIGIAVNHAYYPNLEVWGHSKAVEGQRQSGRTTYQEWQQQQENHNDRQ